MKRDEMTALRGATFLDSTEKPLWSRTKIADDEGRNYLIVSPRDFGELQDGLMKAHASGVTEEQCRYAVDGYLHLWLGSGAFGPYEVVVTRLAVNSWEEHDALRKAYWRAQRAS